MDFSKLHQGVKISFVNERSEDSIHTTINGAVYGGFRLPQIDNLYHLPINHLYLHPDLSITFDYDNQDPHYDLKTAKQEFKNHPYLKMSMDEFMMSISDYRLHVFAQFIVTLQEQRALFETSYGQEVLNEEFKWTETEQGFGKYTPRSDMDSLRDNGIDRKNPAEMLGNVYEYCRLLQKATHISNLLYRWVVNVHINRITEACSKNLNQTLIIEVGKFEGWGAQQIQEALSQQLMQDINRDFNYMAWHSYLEVAINRIPEEKNDIFQNANLSGLTEVVGKA